ncbi:unnamed protein product [Soboliphyme baturini]|uniref:Reverse transcriptase domain-containing protein n=1 Tax=Soboliphyme baturini TaxID=241478 RepID=A0A183IVB7_9BILA|nr:unnamed protein product [Soboliphyme baturini]
MRQSDPFSSKLFNACLEMVFRKMNWKGCVNINDKQLNHLRLSEDVVLIANNAREMTEMLQELNERSNEVGYKISATQTKAMQSVCMLKTILQVDSVDFKDVNTYVYLGQELKMRHDVLRKIIRRSAAG